MRIAEEIECEEFEVDDEADGFTYSYRQMVWQPFSAYFLPSWQEFKDEEENCEPIVYDICSEDLEMWKQIMDGLANRIFCDRDWQTTAINPQILDGIDPNLGVSVGLTDDYITNHLPKVAPQQASQLLTAIKRWSKA